MGFSSCFLKFWMSPSNFDYSFNDVVSSTFRTVVGTHSNDVSEK